MTKIQFYPNFWNWKRKVSLF